MKALEAAGAGRYQLTKNGTVIRVTHVDRRADISLQPSRIVSQPTIRAWSGAYDSSNGPQVDGHVRKRTGCDKASSYTWWERESEVAIWG